MINPKHMTKAVALALACMFCGAPLTPQEKKSPVVAVLEPTGNETKLVKATMRGIIESAVSKSRKYKVLNRLDSGLAGLEKAFAEKDGAISDDGARAIAKRLGADYMCASDVYKEGGQIKMTIAMLNVATGVRHERSGQMKEGGRNMQMVAEDLVGALMASDLTALPPKPEASSPGVLMGFVRSTRIKYEVRLMADGQTVRVRFDASGLGHDSWPYRTVITWELEDAVNVGHSGEQITAVGDDSIQDVTLKVINPGQPVKLGSFLAKKIEHR